MAVMVSRCLSTSPLAVVPKFWLTPLSNCAYTTWLLAEGHSIRFWWTVLQVLRGSAAERSWALWGASWPGCSCISPGPGPVRCSVFPWSLHFILARCNFRPCRFLHTILQMHRAFMVEFSLSCVNAIRSVRLGLWGVKERLACSPELSPVENVWSIMEGKILMPQLVLSLLECFTECS